MTEIPKTSSFTKLDYVHIVVMAFKNEDNRLELGVWGYRTAEDATQRFNRVMEMHNKHENSGHESPLVATETFIVGIYDDFEQSLFVEVSPSEIKEN